MAHRGIVVALFLALLPGRGFANGLTDQLFTHTEHDFGKVQRGEKLSHQFVLQNTGSKEIRIKKIRVSCGCTTATAASERIAPGESTVIDAVMDTSGFQGNKSVTIFVSIDRPWRTEAPLRISATSLGSVGGGGQSEVDFGIVPAGASAVKRLNLDYTGNPKWEIVGLDFGNPAFKAEVAEISRDQNLVRYELTITLAEGAPNGVLEDKIVLHTNDGKSKDVVVVAKAKVEPKLSASPDNLRLGALTAGQKITKNVILKADSPFKVVRVENTKGLFEVRSAPEPKKTQLLVVTLTAPDDAGKLPDHIEVITDLPDAQSVSIGLQD